MRNFLDHDAFRRAALGEPSLHILCLGWEERCLGYARELRGAAVSGVVQKIMCIDPGDNGVSSYLESIREENRNELNQLLAVDFKHDIEDAIRGIIESISNYRSCCVDLSCMPRHLMFRLLPKLIRACSNGIRLFVSYSYPKTYLPGTLQDPAGDVYEVESAGASAAGKTGLIIIPGFDSEFCTLMMMYVRLRNNRQQFPTRWLFPVGRDRYQLYERALEQNLYLVGTDSCELLPQDEIVMATSQLVTAITALADGPVYIAPLGPRISCVPVILALNAVELRDRKVFVLLPRTARYRSVRSVGVSTPLVEELAVERWPT